MPPRTRYDFTLLSEAKPPRRVQRCTSAGRFTIFRQYRTIPALRLKHRSGDCGTASALPKCSIMSGCGTRIVLRGQKPLALCDRCPCFGSLFPPLAALTFAASSIICAFGLAAAAPRSPYRHLELCGIALKIKSVLPEWHSARSCHSASAAGYRHPAQHSRWRRSGAKMPSGRHRTERRTGPHTRSDSARCKGATA